MKTLSLANTRNLPQSDISGIENTRLGRWSAARLIRAAGIVVCFVISAAIVKAADPASVPAASAASIVGREAELNGTPMLAGATLFPGDVVRLGESSTAALRFDNSTVLAAPGTEFVVETAGIRLRGGRLQVRAAGTEQFAVLAPFFRVSVAAAGGVTSSAEIRLGGMRAQIDAVAGAADVTATGSLAPYTLHAGETATLDASGAEAAPADGAAASSAAGQVTRLIPQVQIDRGSQHLVAGGSERIYSNDGLRSGPTGRAQVTLKDGSLLSLASDSSLRIDQQDAQAQQTSIDLLAGRMRGKVTKVMRAVGKFEVHTPMGVASLVGTDFSLLVTNDFVELMVFDGSVRFANISGQTVTVAAGNKVRISKAGAFEGPFPISPQEVQSAQGLTDMTGATGQTAAAGGARPLVPLVITLAGTAAGIGIGVWQATRPTVSVSIP